MEAAYVLAKFRPDADLSKARHAMQFPEIQSVEMVLGPYDAIVRCEAADLAALGELAKRIRGCPGVMESITCLVV